ncbi:MAG: SpoIIE family protein phosphatase [Acidimicrobiales bacterium]
MVRASRWARAGVRRQLGALGLVYLVIVLTGAVVTLLSLDRYNTDAENRRRLLTDLTVIERLRSAYSDQETAQRGYVISGEASFLGPYDSGRKTEDDALATLSKELQSHEPLAREVATVAALANRWRTDNAEPEITARREQGQEAASRLVAIGTGKAQFDELRSAVNVLATDIAAQAEKATNAATNARRQAVAALIASVASTGSVSVASALLLRRWVVQPLESLTEAVSRLEAGELVQVPVNGPRELRSVSIAVDQMQQTLRQQRDNAIRNREVIEQNALLTVQLGNELAGALGEFPPGWTVASSLRAAQGVAAGDCYDVALLSPTTIGLVLLDIAGHGVEASILALKCKELLRAALRNDFPPGEALSWLLSNASGLEDTFLTAFVARIETNTGVISYANAGHPAALLRTGDSLTPLPGTGPLVGPIVGVDWQTVKDVFPPGSTLVAYTDGLTEARDASGGFFGESRVQELLASAPTDASATVTLRHIVDELDRFAPRLRDDATIVVVAHA